VRRAVSALLLVALAAAGAASAGLLGSPRVAQALSASDPSGLCQTVTAPPPATSGSAVTPGGQVTATTARAPETGATPPEARRPAGVTTASTTRVQATVSAETSSATLEATPPAAPTTGATTEGQVTTTAVATTAPASTALGTTGSAAVTSAPSAGCLGSSVSTPTKGTGPTRLVPSNVSAVAASTVVLTGHGWGHGMGMSQWGAYGYSEHGWSAAQILRHYYPGTTIGTQTSPPVRVLVSGPDVRVRLGSATPWHVVDARGTSLALAGGSFVLPASLRVAGRKLVSPLRFTPGASPVEAAGRPYRGGLLVVSDGTKLQVVNTVGMESYLEGVVGEEMPSSWPLVALEAQAVAARSYALFQLEDVVTASPFALYSDTRSQVYAGIDGESAAVRAAVRATAHEVVLYHGKVAMTEYSSSSGGQTVSAAEAVGTAVPYLLSVPDPYDTLSPFHDWGPILISAASAGSALGLDGPLVDLETVRGPSRHVETATAVGPTGRLTLSGSQIEADLGLRSTWFEVGWLSLTGPPAPVPFGAVASLGGIARGLSGVFLEAKVAGADWRPIGEVVPGPNGDFSVLETPRATTSYRLAVGAIRAAEITVSVRVSVSAALGAAGVEGTVAPFAAGESVTLERQSGEMWSAVATATTGADGRFVIEATLAPGTYRVGCRPSGALAAGYSGLLAAP